MRRNKKGQFVPTKKKAPVRKGKASTRKKHTSAESKTIKSVPKPVPGNFAMRLQNTRGSHNKEYYIRQKGNVVTVIWGPIGGWKRSKDHKFKSAKEASVWAIKQARAKYGRGYDT